MYISLEHLTHCPLRVSDADHTLVVHVGGHLDDTEAEVDGQIIEMFIRLQDKLSTQLHALALVIHLVD